jgi:hypothetical protein
MPTFPGAVSYSDGMGTLLQASYSKKLSLPNYSSHSFMVTLSAEIGSLRKLQSETKRLYALLQNTVDEQLKAVGFLPDTSNYGVIGDKPTNGSTVKAAALRNAATSSETQGCSDKQRALIEKVAKREKFALVDLDGIAQALFQLPLARLDKRQTSRFISELLLLAGPPRFRNGSKQPAAVVANA